MSSNLSELFLHAYVGSNGQPVSCDNQSRAIYWVVEAAKHGRQSEVLVRETPGSDWHRDEDGMSKAQAKIAALKPDQIVQPKGRSVSASKDVTLKAALSELSRVAGFLAKNGTNDAGIELLRKSMSTVQEQLSPAKKK